MLEIKKKMKRRKYNKNRNRITYFAFLEKGKAGFRVKTARKLNNVNQFTSHWERTDSRELAREVNREGLVIK